MIFTITGPSGSGKTSMVRFLLKKFPNSFQEVVSTTTRAMRPREVEGRDYYFVNPAEFALLIETDEMAEHVEFAGNSYGITKSELQRIARVANYDRHAVIVVDRKGAEKIKNLCGDFAKNVYIEVDKKHAKKHLIHRDGWAKAKKRIAADEQEGLFNTNGYDCILKNDKTIEDFVNNFCNYVIAAEYNCKKNNMSASGGKNR